MPDHGPAVQRPYVIAVGLVLMVVAVYHPVAGHDFTLYDDPSYVTHNPYVQQGLTAQSLNWAWTSLDGGVTWHPLTWMSHMLDVELFGDQPGGHHLTSMLLHAVNSVLLFFLLAQMTGATWRSAAVAAVFAVHPVNVESVAWIAQRKNVLSTMFGLLSLLAYAGYAKRGGAGRYLLAFGAMALSLTAKPALVTLPCVMLLLDVWPLGRVKGLQGAVPTARPWITLVIEKLPMFALTAASCATTMYTQTVGSAVRSFDDLPLAPRLANAVVSYALYVRKLILPTDMSIGIPHPSLIGDGAGWPLLAIVGAAAVLVGLSVLACSAARQAKYRYVLIGWLWFLGVLVPMIGIVQVGEAALAERYGYVPLIGLMIMLVWAAADRFEPSVLKKIGAAVLLILALVSYLQVGYWQNNRSLFMAALMVNEKNPLAHDMLAGEMVVAGDLNRAMFHARRAHTLKPNDAQLVSNLASVHALRQEDRLAVDLYRKAVTMRPHLIGAHRGLGAVLMRQGKLEEAVAALETAVRVEPTNIRGMILLGEALARLERFDQAVAVYEHALQFAPDNAVLQQGLARAREKSSAWSY